MKQLKCLNVKDCPSLIRMPRGLPQLINLHTLPRFIVGKNDGYTISELQTLGGLQGELHLESLENVSGGDDAVTGNLMNKTMLKSLSLQWKWNSPEEENDNAEIQEVLEKLQPNKGLIKLEIISYTGRQFPSWMIGEKPYLNSLEEIRLFNLKHCQTLPPLGLLIRLRVAEISGMDAITKVDEEFYGAGGTFPCLQKLTFSQMLKLEQWKDVKGRTMFPCLTTLTFIHCPKLTSLEMELPYVTELTMWLNNEGLCSSSGALNGLTGSLKKLSISLCEHLLESSECEGLQGLGALEELEICGCQELTNLPRGVEHLNTIRSLTIINCNNLVALPNWLDDKLTSLLSLSISGCHQLQFIPKGLRLRTNLDINIEACPLLL